jgi:hypothetical protein
MIDEVWRPIPDWEGFYEVSDQGRVRSLDHIGRGCYGTTRLYRGRILKGGLDTDGYPQHILTAEGRRRSVKAHNAVLAAFVGPCPPGLEARHWDDIKTNNWLGNLTYGTREDNAQDRVRNGNDANARKTHCVNGHEFTPENTRIRIRDGRISRDCRACDRDRYHRRSNS